jgi:hypothetical protein
VFFTNCFSCLPWNTTLPSKRPIVQAASSHVLYITARTLPVIRSSTNSSGTLIHINRMAFASFFRCSSEGVILLAVMKLLRRAPFVSQI